MTPLRFWIVQVAVGLLYQGAKMAMGFGFALHSFAACVIWTGFSMWAVSSGKVKP